MVTAAKSVFRVRVRGNQDEVWRFLRAHPLEAQEVEIGHGQVRLDLTVDQRQREELLQRGLHIEAAIDLYANLLARRLEVEPADRFNGGRIPEGIGRLLK